jgi:integrase
MKGIIKTANGYRIIARVRVNGKIVQRRKTVPCTKEEAKALHEQLKTQIRSGKSDLCSLTLPLKLYKHLVAVYREKKGPFSDSHENKVGRLEKEHGDLDNVQVPERFEYFIAGLRVKGINYLANRFIEIVRAQFKLGVDLGHFKSNPISKARFPFSKETARDIFLPASEIRKIILTAAKNRNTRHIARLLQFYFSVPSRKTEIIRMKILDVDIFNWRVRVYNGTTKNDAGVWKPIPPTMRSWFKQRIRNSKSLKEPVFGRVVHGIILSIGDFKHAWNTVRTACGYPKLRIHDSRHISATELVNNGTPRTVVNAIANWKTDMLKIYYHLDSDAALANVKWPDPQKREAVVKPVNAKIL